MRVFWVIALLGVLSPASAQDAVPVAAVLNATVLNGVPKPYLFTWLSLMYAAGAGWAPGETVGIVLNGPLNSPGVAAADLPLGALRADAFGNFVGAVRIPFDSGVTGPAARIPRPGLYRLIAAGESTSMAPGGFVNLAPATYTGPGGAPFDWGHERGGRDGVLPGPFHALSPERADPEWATVWDERPVEVYGTVAPTGPDGDNQPSLISPSDNPITHSAHDGIFFLVPDFAYQWVIGTSNYYAGDPDGAGLGRIEIEWETRNGGSTDAYGSGAIGLPLWALPSAGDRVYAVGRWILDEGHPEVGARTEIHPPRLIAVMRQGPSANTSGGAASQVDIYASGHGGGANRVPRGLSALLDQGGYGGGRLQDVLSSEDQQLYYRPGPLPSLLVSAVNTALQQIAGQPLQGEVFATAGPSAFSWGAKQPEEIPINDMDYDFDVPLPVPPAGAKRPVAEIVRRAEHTATVVESITYSYPDPASGLPRAAHIHLPYKGAGSGVYARTLRFSWDAASPPPAHFRVHINSVTPADLPGKWRLWADVNGQWLDLSALAPGLLNAAAGTPVAIPDTPVDAYLKAQGTLRIFVQGYRAACLDRYFGTLFDTAAYIGGLNFLVNCGPADNDDLGGAVAEFDAKGAPGAHRLTAAGPNKQSHFTVDLTVDAVP